jgi:hypothetical protein
MEAVGSAKIMQELFDTHNMYIHEYIGDDDSSTKKVLRHSWQEEMEHGMREELPKYSTEKKQTTGSYQLTTHRLSGWQIKDIT